MLQDRRLPCAREDQMDTSSARMNAWLVALLVVITALLIAPLLDFGGNLDPPPLSPDRYWGPGQAANHKEDTTINNFSISASAEASIDRCKFWRYVVFTWGHILFAWVFPDDINIHI